MPRRQPPPSILLMTDERMGDALWAALERLPRGAGVIVRHYTLAPRARRALFERVRGVARRRGLWLLLAGRARDAAGWRADGVHGRSAGHATARPLLRSAPVHDARALAAAGRRRIDLALVSPVFPTRSHPCARTLGPLRFGLLAARASGGARVIALGGMSARHFARVAPLGAQGWAAIDAWTRASDVEPCRRQNLKVVPR